MSNKEILKLGQETFIQQADELHKLADGLGQSFVDAVNALYKCEGRAIITGLGKSGIIARKLAATLTSTGTPSHFIHPVEAIHGDLGIVRSGDVMVAISRSGNNPEVTGLVALGRHFNMTLIAITGNPDSQLASASDVVLNCSVTREACPLNLTPTTSTTAALVTGDALAVALLKLRQFKPEDFAAFHPGGVLGKSLLLRVSDLMHKGDDLPVISVDVKLRDALEVIIDKKLGAVCVTDSSGKLVGVCVDGDVKRLVLANNNALDLPLDELMSTSPSTIKPDELVATALRIMESREAGPITSLVVVNDANEPVGILHIHDILRSGIY
ncbi:MAG: KpsF/GutQ family sugar-phosphate isomerase [bacterium]|nr:KpsF/GutQ family sugar-phosphate isomerase [bacterium]